MTGTQRAYQRLISRHAMCVLFALAAAYFWHAFVRWISGAWADSDWPRGFPWPDRWLQWLHDWFVATFPVPPGVLDLHGKTYEVRFAVLGAAMLFTVAAIATVTPVILRVLSARSHRAAGECETRGYLLRGVAGDACPECGEAIHPVARRNANQPSGE